MYTEVNLSYNIEDLRRIWQQATGDLGGVECCLGTYGYGQYKAMGGKYRRRRRNGILVGLDEVSSS